MKKKNIIIIIATLAAIGIGAFLYFGNKSANNIKLETGKVSRITITNSVTATGTLEPVTQVEVGTQVSGIITKIHVDFNSVVTKGQLIAEMDKVNLQADLSSKQADLASNKNEFDYQQQNYTRSKALYEKKLISDSDYETATYNFQKAKTAYDRSKSDIIKVKRNLEYATITSPIDGVIINRAVEEGQTVAAGFSTPKLFTIANDLTKMQVIANVDEADIGQVEVGQSVKFTVDAYPNTIFDGKVTQIRLEATVTSNVVTYEVVISAHNPDLKLKPGLTASVTINTLERSNVPSIPSKALRFVPDEKTLSKLKLTADSMLVEAPAGKKIVWKITGNKLEPKVVSVGASNGNKVEVVDGLGDNDEVVVDITTVEKGTPKEPERSPFMPTRQRGTRIR